MRITIYASLRIQYVALRMMKHNVAESKERRSWQRFRETVCCLILSVDLAELDCSIVD
jgi:hypothetical protein